MTFRKLFLPGRGKGVKKDIVDSRLTGRIELLEGDITRLALDAIVNAANRSLLGGGGVDGAIHRAAGPGLLEECSGLGGCPTGEARITGGYGLPARYVIHAVGPVYRVDGEQAPALLASCYRWCLRLAVEHGLATIAFPALSCGAYGYPVEEACRVALDTTCDFLAADPSIRKVIFALYSQRNREAYLEYLAEKSGRPPA